jgi:Sigma-54 interaction domain
MPSGTTTDRPFLTESGMGGELADSAIHEFSDRPPKVFVGANCAPASSPPPDNLWFIRLSDWLPASQTQPRSGGSQLAEGGTIFFEGIEDFAAEFQSHPPLGLEKSETQPKDEQRVILWSRTDDPSALRAVTIGGISQTKGTKLVCGEIEAAEEPAFEMSLGASREIPEHPLVLPDDVLPENVACSLLVWTLWTNPQYQ